MNIKNGRLARIRQSRMSNQVIAEEKPVHKSSGNNISLAIPYVKVQELNDIYSVRDALYYGTLFPELNFPYCKGGAK